MLFSTLWITSHLFRFSLLFFAQDWHKTHPIFFSKCKILLWWHILGSFCEVQVSREYFFLHALQLTSHFVIFRIHHFFSYFSLKPRFLHVRNIVAENKSSDPESYDSKFVINLYISLKVPKWQSDVVIQIVLTWNAILKKSIFRIRNICKMPFCVAFLLHSIF